MQAKNWTVFTWQRHIELINPFWEAAEETYEARIRRAREIVPEDRLLIWNLKDGWKPLCDFLGKPIPDIPIPVFI
jgi:hypothetical protein